MGPGTNIWTLSILEFLAPGKITFLFLEWSLIIIKFKNIHFSLWDKCWAVFYAPWLGKWVVGWQVRLFCALTLEEFPLFSPVPSLFLQTLSSEIFFWLWWVEWLPLPFAVASFHILNYNFSNLFQMSIYFYLLISLHFLFFTIIGCLFSFFVILCFNKVNALPLSAILNWRLDIYWKYTLLFLSD